MGGKLSVVAQEHAAAVLSGLAPIGSNAQAIRAAKGIDPLVQLLLTGNAQAKEHSAVALSQLALRAQAALEIAKAGAVSAFVTWLWNPTLGPPLVAVRNRSRQSGHAGSDDRGGRHLAAGGDGSISGGDEPPRVYGKHESTGSC